MTAPPAIVAVLRLSIWLLVATGAVRVHAVARLVVDSGPQAVRSLSVRAHIVDGAAVTRVEQRFFTGPGGQGAYRATIPVEAEVTDLVAWIGDRRLQGTVFSSRAVHRFDGIAVLERLSVSADGLDQVVGVELDLPPADELLMQLEYLETLPESAARRRYRLPMSEAADSLSVTVQVSGAAETRVSAGGFPAGTLQVTPRDGGAGVRAEVSGYPGGRELELTIDRPGSTAPRLLSWRGASGDGFFAAWLPVTGPMALPGTAPALSLVVDLSSADGTAAALLDGLGGLVEGLSADHRLGVVVSGRPGVGVGLQPATTAVVDQVLGLLDTARGVVPGDRGVDALAAAIRLAGAGADVYEGPWYLLVATDEAARMDEGPAADVLRELALELDPLVRGWVIQAGDERDDEGDGTLAQALAQWLGEPLLAPSGPHQIAADLDRIGRRLDEDHAFVNRIDVPTAGAWDLAPPRIGWVPVGSEAMQTGRYAVAGPSPLRVHGLSTAFEAASAVHLADADTSSPVLDDAVLLSEDFEAGHMGAFTVAGGSSGQWHVDPGDGVLRLSRSRGIGRAYAVVPASSYTIQARMRILGSQGKIILMEADRQEYRRVDLFPGGGRVRVVTASSHVSRYYPLEVGRWHDVRVEVGELLVRVWIDGSLVHEAVPLDRVPDGVIGLGAYAADSVAFDDILVLRGTASDAGFVQGLLPDRLDRAPATLWATRRARELERHRLLFGAVAELEEALIDVGLTYRAVTRQSPLALVLPAVASRQVAVGSRYPVAEDSASGTAPASVATAAEPLAPNVPNPFNASTMIAFALPAHVQEGALVRIVIYNGAGQTVRVLNVDATLFRRGRVLWDGLDEAGRPAASGVYRYALQVGERRMAARSMTLVR